MHCFKIVSLLLLLVFSLGLAPTLVTAADLRAYHNSLEARYTRAHSLGKNYQFDSRDGWQTVNASNLQYKYSREPEDESDLEGLDDPDDSSAGLTKRDNKTKATSKSKSTTKAKSTSKAKSKSKKTSSKTKATGSLSSSLKKIIDTIKGKGKAEPVTITWYTGHDLENPSCWPQPTWAPTDASFACALTLEGWTTKPQCFKFLELCNTPKKCVFVRVVDSCAGCATGSKHVDLTQAAFTALADLGTGVMQVQMRQATDPDGWLENLWGPKA